MNPRHKGFRIVIEFDFERPDPTATRLLEEALLKRARSFAKEHGGRRLAVRSDYGRHGVWTLDAAVERRQ